MHETTVENLNMPGTNVSVHIINENGERVRTVIEKTHTISRIKNYSIYLGMYDDLQKHTIPGNPDGYTSDLNGDVYIMPRDTEESRFLCHIGGVSLKYFSAGGYNDLKTGDWFGIMIRPTKHYLEENNLAAYNDGQGNMSAESWVDNDMVIVNIKTGEYVISRYME